MATLEELSQAVVQLNLDNKKLRRSIKRILKKSNIDHRIPLLATNFDLEDAVFPPTVRVTHGGAQSTTSGVIKTLAFDTERFDTDTMHDTSTTNSRLTVNTAGKYLIIGHGRFQGSSTGRREISILLNGATTIAIQEWDAGSAGDAGVIAMHVSTIWDMDRGNYVELRVFQTSSIGLNIESSGSFSPEFMMVRVGA